MKKIEDYFNEEAAKHDDLFVQKMGMTEFYDEIEHQIERCYKKSNRFGFKLLCNAPF
jgi:tRNA (cmo5U34)-methyltransferase